MLQKYKRYTGNFRGLQALAASADPSRTAGLQRAFVADFNRRFNELEKVIKKSIVDEDCFGLNTTHELNFNLASSGPRRFVFARSGDKVAAFMAWLNEQVNKGLLTTGTLNRIGDSAEQAWTNKYVFDSYKRGVIRARYELDKAGFNVPKVGDVGGIEMSMSTPFHMDRVGLLYTRVFSELKGITAAMDQQISRVLAQGIADGDNPRLLARKLVATINGEGLGDLGITDTLGRFIPAKRRAEMLARTEIIRAHHQASIIEYRNWGLSNVTVVVEWFTAGDNRVCSICEKLQGKIFTLDEIEGMIPLHPRCRCVAIPFSSSTQRRVDAIKESAPMIPGDVSTFFKSTDVLTATNELKTLFKNEKLSVIGDQISAANINDLGASVRDEVLNTFPELEKYLPKLKSIVFGGIKSTGVRNELPDLGTSIAYYWEHKKLIRIGANRISTRRANLSVGGAWTVGTDYNSVFRHELGHFVHWSVPNLFEEWAYKFRHLSNDKAFSALEWFKVKVSVYSGSNYMEAFAESFTAYTSPLYKKGMLPKEIEEFFDEYLKLKL